MQFRRATTAIDYAASTRQAKALDFTSAGLIDYFDLTGESGKWSDHEHRFKGFGDDLYIWKMPQFDLPVGEVNEVMEKLPRYKTLVIDVRGNGGGYVDTLLQVIGNLFDHDVKVADRKRRNETKQLIARTRGHDIFKGQLIILTDNGSASAAEILPRPRCRQRTGSCAEPA